MFDRFWRFLLRRWQRAETIYKLHKLDDRLLADIGISRDQIADAVTARELEQDHADQHIGDLRPRERADAGRGRYRHGLGPDLAR